jgi:hypothetical protein
MWVFYRLIGGFLFDHGFMWLYFDIYKLFCYDWLKFYGLVPFGVQWLLYIDAFLTRIVQN